nr:DUF4386 family protein [Arthrobacter sp. ISL-69]
MNATVAAAVLLIVLPLAFNAAFAALAAKFNDPDILRRLTGEVLERFRQGGSGLVLLWWAFAMTAVLLAPLAVLLAGVMPGADPVLLSLGSTVGVLAAVVQFLGLVRWPFLVPYLARMAGDPDASEARKEAVDIVFQAFNRFLGVAWASIWATPSLEHGACWLASQSCRATPCRRGWESWGLWSVRCWLSARWSSSARSSATAGKRPRSSHPSSTSHGRCGS